MAKGRKEAQDNTTRGDVLPPCKSNRNDPRVTNSVKGHGHTEQDVEQDVELASTCVCDSKGKSATRDARDTPSPKRDHCDPDRTHAPWRSPRRDARGGHDLPRPVLRHQSVSREETFALQYYVIDI